jgi:hypothetical protein
MTTARWEALYRPGPVLAVRGGVLLIRQEVDVPTEFDPLVVLPVENDLEA